MFTLNVSGNTIAELKNKIAELHSELNGAELIERQPGLPNVEVEKSLPEKSKKILELVPEAKSVMEQVVYVPVESSIDGVDVSDLDKDGLPWDERINSPIKIKDRFGRWKKRLGVSTEDRYRIVEELKGNVKTKTKQPEPEVVPDTFVLPDMKEPISEVPAPTFVPEPEAPTAYEPSFNEEHFKNNFSVVMSELFSAKKITMEKVQQLCEIARVQQAWQIPTNETSLKAVYNNLVQERLI